MTSDRIREIQVSTAYPNSVSVKQALLQVWNECEQENGLKGLYWIETEKESPKENQKVLAWNGFRIFDTSWQKYTGLDEEKFKETYTHWIPRPNVPLKHFLFKTGDKDAPESIKYGNGEVVLSLCRVCGKGEGDLEKYCYGDTKPPQPDFEYEMLIDDEGTPFEINSWIPVATDRIKDPSRIDEYIKKGLIRKIKTT